MEGHALTEPRAGYVYILTHPLFPGYIKVGRTHNLRRRLAAYNSGCPHRMFQYLFTFFVANCIASEAAAHSRLRRWNIPGTEWYQMHPDDAFALLANLPSEDDCLVTRID